jgi:hypothetical protein
MRYRSRFAERKLREFSHWFKAVMASGAHRTRTVRFPGTADVSAVHSERFHA